MNIYVLTKFHILVNILIIVLLESILLIIVPDNYLIILILIYIIVTYLAIQYFYSWKLLFDTKAICYQFNLFTTQYKRAYPWTEIGSVRYRLRKVFLYDKNNKRIFTIGKEMKNFEQICFKIKQFISTESCIVDMGFIEFINNIKP